VESHWARWEAPRHYGRHQANAKIWAEFFEDPAIAFFLRIINFVLERLEPVFVKDLPRLNEKLCTQSRKNPHAELLQMNPCHLINLTVL